MDMEPLVCDAAGGADEHGGSLLAAAALFPGATLPWIDLSTGINPHPYPVSPLPASALRRLPEAAHLAALADAAVRAYGAPENGCVVAAPGTQILLSPVCGLVGRGRARILSPTYAGHARAAALAGHLVQEVDSFAALADADLAIVVNPNNPDGSVSRRARLLELAARLRARGGLLVVDEAFMDVGPRAESLAGDVTSGGIVVLRSFGKFFGLAGLRLGFALTAPGAAARLAARLGPWAVSGPALMAGLEALPDLAWQRAARRRLKAEAGRLDALLAAHGVRVGGGTSLYRFVEPVPANSLHEALGRRGIAVRRFAGRPDCLRIGLPDGEAAFARLAQALLAWRIEQEGAR